MDIVTATKIIQDQATANGISFDDEFWCIANNLKSCSKDVYDAWTVFQNSASEYCSRMADRTRIQQLARDVKRLNSVQQSYYDSL